MEKLEIILSLAGTAIGFMATTITLLVKFLKNTKAKKAAEQTIKICNAILPYIKQAESFLNYSGKEKKEFVMTKANQFAIKSGIAFNAEIIDMKIEELIKLTRDVNSRENDKKYFDQTIIGNSQKETNQNLSYTKL